MDPIDEIKLKPNCFIASFKTLHSQKQVEILKTRVHKKNNPDYWEPSRPVTNYGMKTLPKGPSDEEREKTRWRLQNRKVYYIDFRYMISAFDKFFYFTPDGVAERQRVLRKRAKNINKCFHNGTAGHYYKRIGNAPIRFDTETIKIISEILGKKYKNISYTTHNFYSEAFGMGFVMKYTLEDKGYSEAYAGSGETVIAKMIYDLHNVEDNSLVLLDEPETSLHPRAQKLLVNYLMELVIKKHLQVVISTHSPDIIADMPSRAINVFYECDGKTHIRESVVPENAFLSLGHDIIGKMILVEDKLAENIVMQVAGHEKIAGLFETEHYSGGASALFKAMVEYSKIPNQNVYFIMDGDQKHGDNAAIQDSIDRNSTTVQELQLLIEEITQMKLSNLPFNPDSNATDEQKVEIMKKFLQFYLDHVFYLPGSIPEAIIYSDERLDHLCSSFSADKKEQIKGEADYKKKFVLISECLYNKSDSAHVLNSEEMFINSWCSQTSDEYNHIKSILDQL
jgi:hypothetical protein